MMPFMKPFEMINSLTEHLTQGRRLLYRLQQLDFEELYTLWEAHEKSKFITALQNRHFELCLDMLTIKREGWETFSMEQLRRMARKCRIKSYTTLNKNQLIVLLRIKEADREKAFTSGIPTDDSATQSKTN